jgi:hypothetical protein
MALTATLITRDPTGAIGIGLTDTGTTIKKVPSPIGRRCGFATRGLLARLQEIVVSEQLERYCETVRPCPRCHSRRHLKDYRSRRYDTVFGRLVVGGPALMVAVIVVKDA